MEKIVGNKQGRVQEENFCELVSQFLVVFDKFHKGYKEKEAEVKA